MREIAAVCFESTCVQICTDIELKGHWRPRREGTWRATDPGVPTGLPDPSEGQERARLPSSDPLTPDTLQLHCGSGPKTETRAWCPCRCLLRARVRAPSSPLPKPNKRTVLGCLTKKRLFEIDRRFDVGTAQAESKADFVEGLAQSKAASFRKVLDELLLAELKAVCRAHELAVSGSKSDLAARILGEEDEGSDDDHAPSDAPPAGEQVSLDLEAFFARSQPTVRAIVPMLARDELSTLLRRLDEQHGIRLDLSALDPGVASLAAALDTACELPVLLSELGRAQLAKVCQRYALTPEDGSRDGHIRTILAAASGITVEEARAVEAEEPRAQTDGDPAAESPSPDLEDYRAAVASLPRGVLHRITGDLDPGEPPEPGEIVRARHRQYLVSEVVRPPDLQTRHARTGLRPCTLVKLVCLDDDAQGRPLEILWELELGAQRIDPAREGIGTIEGFDDPDAFEAYYRALQWNCVTTATRPDDERVQAPFRAGISIMQHQLVPLQKALSLPRANLFVADDVGLGKTIEAGLILQELLLRQRLELIVIVCPASICLQWRAEMERRFGVRFDIVNREHVARIRRERGAATNPWDCGRRFIVSYQTLRRPEYQESLRGALGGRRSKSMLVLDEAHTVAPSSNQRRYAVDSQLTKLARAIAPAFENRLFLSATPHNGHSNSFSALLELLDPTRFTRGVPVEGRAELDAVMIRRLKRDLKGISSLQFPERKLVELRLVREGDAWSLERAVRKGDTEPAEALGSTETHELQLSELLAEYTDLCAPSAKRDRQVFIGLQKRLLSSCAAFARTLGVHCRRTGQRILEQLDDTPRDAAPEDGEVISAELDDAVEDAVASGGALPTAESDRKRAEALLERMQILSKGSHLRPEAKILALVDWIRRHQCPAAGSEWFETPKNASRAWTETRLLIFTEYAHTADYIIRMLRGALQGTEREHDRIAYFHGAMSDDQRRDLQASFNAHPEREPLRILVATDAAREGVNLQAYCADLIHYDIPWNPGRLEQRNGRIDRTLQPSPEVRCMYFAYPQRREDRVLQVLVEKVERITHELGSLSAVILDRIEDALEPHGIDGEAQQRLELASEGDAQERDTAVREMEAAPSDRAKLGEAIEEAAECYERSRTFFAPDAEGLRETVGIALAMAGAERGFTPTDEVRDPRYPDEATHFAVPDLPVEWRQTVDTLRRPKPKDLDWWEWRRDYPPRPVVFEPLRRMTDDVIQLHLEHPFVRRALRRFIAQGYAAHDLNRASLLRYPGTRDRVALIGRLSLFGAGATRLHDGLLHWFGEIRSGGEVVPLTSESERTKTLDQMREAMRRPGTVWTPPADFIANRLARVSQDVAALWPLLRTRAKDEATELSSLLDDRGAREAEQLRKILTAQQTKIRRVLGRDDPSELQAGKGQESPEARQRRLDRGHMSERLGALEQELATEPARLRDHYRVLTRRIEAVGLVYLVPETR